MINRRQFLAAGGAGMAVGLAGAGRATGSAAKAPPDEFARGAAALELSVQPTRVYKRGPDQDRLRQEYWLFTLVLLSAHASKPRVDSLSVDYLAQGELRRSTTWPRSVVAALDLVPTVPSTPARDRYPVAAFQIADTMASELAIDTAHCALTCLLDSGPQRIELRVPIGAYEQKTRLVFPFRGRGMITQGGAWNDGHRNRSGMFAVDAIGLTDLYAAMVGEGDAPEAVAGWGRPILAPAAGRVVVVRGDRPDQPVTGVSDSRYFAAEFPQGGDPGNHVVIDHGNGEFSMLAHLQQGSVRVGLDDRLEQGQVVGLLGNSGDSNTPHVHHQLQAGAQWASADALPHAYANGPERQHDRGTIFNAVDPRP